jgi:Uma2 family endonuclease
MEISAMLRIANRSTICIESRTMPHATPQMTIDEFLKLPSSDCLKELVRGRVIESKLRTPRHGQVCMEIGGRIWSHVRQAKIGTVVGGNSGIVTRREPDSVRGPDLAFFSQARLPAQRLPSGYLQVQPELVIDVLDDSEHWYDVIEKALEYLHAGVLVVCIADPKKESLAVFREGQAPKLLHAQDNFSLPEILGEFRVAVKEFFE